MIDRQADDRRLVQYLLGEELAEAEQAEIEERYFNDDLYFDHILAVEDELIDRHLRGSLPEDAKARFEEHFLLSSRRRGKWEAQRAIISFFQSQTQPADFVSSFIRFLRTITPWSKILIGVSVVVVTLGVGLLAWAYLNLRNEMGDPVASLTQVHPQAQGFSDVVTFALQPERIRSGAVGQLRLSQNARWVVLQAALPEIFTEYSTFAATLTTAEGQEIWAQNGLGRDGSAVEVDLPESALKRGDYILSLSAVDAGRTKALPAYQFRIDR